MLRYLILKKMTPKNPNNFIIFVLNMILKLICTWLCVSNFNHVIFVFRVVRIPLQRNWKHLHRHSSTCTLILWQLPITDDHTGTSTRHSQTLKTGCPGWYAETLVGPATTRMWKRSRIWLRGNDDAFSHSMWRHYWLFQWQRLPKTMAHSHLMYSYAIVYRRTYPGTILVIYREAMQDIVKVIVLIWYFCYFCNIEISFMVDLVLVFVGKWK